MFRKLVLASLTALGLAIPLATPATAAPYPPMQYFHHTYVAKYRHHQYGRYHDYMYQQWHYYGTYHGRYEAERVAQRLRYMGYEVRIDARR